MPHLRIVVRIARSTSDGRVFRENLPSGYGSTGER